MLSNEELLIVRGGAFSSTLLNSVSRLINTLLKFGQTVGTVIRRSVTKNYCKIN